MHESFDDRPTRIRWLILFFLGITSAGAYLTRYANSVSSTLIERDLAIEHETMGWVFAAFMVGYLVGQIPGASLGRRMGTRGSLTLVIAAWSCSIAWSAGSESLVPLIASQFAFGLAQAGLVPITSIAIRDWFPASRRGLPSSVVTGAMSAGGVAAMWLTGKLLAWRHDDWQAVFWLYGFLGFGWAVAFWSLYRTNPDRHPWVNAQEVRLIAEDDAAPAEAVPVPASDSTSSRFDVALRMASSLSVWALGCHWFFRSFGYQFFARWFPAFLQERYGMPVDESGFYSSWPMFGVAIGSFAGGYLVDVSFQRTRSRRVSRNAVSFVTLALCATCVGLADLCARGSMFATLMAAGAFFSGISMPAGWAANLDIGGKDSPLLFAVMNMAETAAGIVAPAVVGSMMTAVAGSSGRYGQIVWLHVAMYALAAAAWLLIDPNRSVDRRASAVEMS